MDQRQRDKLRERLSEMFGSQVDVLQVDDDRDYDPEGDYCNPGESSESSGDTSYLVGQDYFYTSDMVLPTTEDVVVIDIYYPNDNPTFPSGLRIVLNFDEETIRVGFKRSTEMPGSIRIHRG